MTTLILRPIFSPSDKSPPDMPAYQVVDGDKVIGRIYQGEYPGGAKWFWSINGLAIRGEHVPGGLADTLAEAQLRLRAAWDVAEKR